MTNTDNRAALAWYVKYPLDAYALGPYRYNEPVTADVPAAAAQASFGELPVEIWPVGPVEEVPEYKYHLAPK